MVNLSYDHLDTSGSKNESGLNLILDVGNTSWEQPLQVPI